MAKFSEPSPLFEPVDPTRVLKGLRGTQSTADTSGSILAGGAVGLFNAGVAIADNEIKERIVSREEEIADEFNSADPTLPLTQLNDGIPRSGLDNEDETPLTSFDANALPSAISASFRQLDRQRVGVAQGKLNQNFFLEKLDAQLKALRHKYPGHRDFIDNEAARQTGLPSANARRAKRLANLESVATSADKSATTLLAAHTKAIKNGAPIEVARTMTVRQADEWSAAQEAVDVAMERHAALAADQTVSDKKIGEDAYSVLATESQTMLRQMTVTTGGPRKLIEEGVAIWERAGGPNQVDPQDIKNTSDGLKQLILHMDSKLNVLVTARDSSCLSVLENINRARAYHPHQGSRCSG